VAQNEHKLVLDYVSRLVYRDRKESEMSLFGPPNIEKLKANRDIQGLVKAYATFGSKSPAIVESVTAALLEIDDPRTVDLLITSLCKDKRQLVRTRVAAVLGQLGDQRAIQPLMDALKDEKVPVVFAARKALQAFKNLPPEALVAAIKDPATSRVAYSLIEQIDDYNKLRDIMYDPIVRSLLWVYSKDLWNGSPRLSARIAGYRGTAGEGKCFRCQRSFAEVTVSVDDKIFKLGDLVQVPNRCKSCGTNFCVDCMTTLKDENAVCPRCQETTGW
jgi:predicted Zn-ribbon and HTH transcriptional regulator